MKLRHTGIVVSNLEKMVRFYTDIMGFEIRSEMSEGDDYIDRLYSLKGARVKTVKMSSGDGPLIELLHFESHPRGAPGRELCDTGYSHIALTVDDVAKEHKRLESRGVSFNWAPQVSPDARAKVACISDPEGNVIELVEELKA